MNKVLIIVAHPDDEVLGCGATIRRLIIERKTIRVLILGEGSSCRYPHSMIGSEEVAKEVAKRKSYAEQSFAVLGVSEVIYGDLPCGRFDTIPLIEIGKQIEYQIAEFGPDTVITHFRHDANSDHRLTFNAVITATRPVPNCCVSHLLTFETPSSTEWRFIEVFRPSLFFDVTEYMETKIKAFECYMPTEGKPFPFPRSDLGLMTLARYRGMQVGVDCAEAFEVVRSIVKTSAVSSL